ncbi:MAG: extracellular solute-binding protein [bacterium]|nr:extracellular solute-binding protein [bacterium]
MKVWKSVIVFVLVLLVSGTVAHQAFSADKEPVTLKVMNWSQQQVGFFKDVNEEFQKEYPWITIEFESMAKKQYDEAMPLRFQSGDAPDVFQWLSQAVRELTVIELLDLGWAAPIHPDDVEITEEFIARWPEGSFLDGINVIDGKYYSFPFNDNVIWGPGYMYYNKAVFKAAGLDPEVAPTTWSELYDACVAIRDKAGAYCLAMPLKSAAELHRFWRPLSGMVMTDMDFMFDYKNGRFAADDPAYLEIFKFLKKMHEDDLVMPGANEKAFSRAALATGQAAIYCDGPWIPGVLDGMGFGDFAGNDLGVAAPPVPDDGRTGSLSQLPSENKWFVSSQTKHPKEAWLFMEWMTRPEGWFGTEYVKRGQGPLAYVDNAKYTEDPVEVKMAKDIAPGMRVPIPLPAMKCPDIAKSKALIEAQNIRRNWEYEEMIEAFLTGKDYIPVATEIAAAKNAKLLEVLKAEAEAGLDVSIDCFTFPEWDYISPYDAANYAK